MVKMNVNRWEFRGIMAKPEHGFSSLGAGALFDYFEEYEDDTGEEIEMDPIAFRCEYSEWESLEEFNEDRQSEYKDLDELRNETMVIEFGYGFIIQEF